MPIPGEAPDPTRPTFYDSGARTTRPGCPTEHAPTSSYRATSRGSSTGRTPAIRPDRRVEAIFEGQEGDVEEMVEWCHDGSPAATVEDVDVTYEDPQGLSGFEIRR